MTSEILKALFYIRKRQIINFYKVNKDSINCPISYIYAIAHDCYPVFADKEEDELYSDCYTITADFISRILNYLSDKEDAYILELQKTKNNAHSLKLLPSFYEIASELNIDVHRKRFELRDALRYIFLDERFGQELWNKIVSDCPIEVSNINKDFSEEEILF